MKKFLLITMMALSIVFGFNSCNSAKFGLVYNVEVTGDGDGNFKVDFPEGYYQMDGTADLKLHVGDSVPFNQVSSKSSVVEKNDKKELEIMRKVNEAVSNDFTATSASGTYDVTIDGTVTEIGTGLSFSIHKHLTNRNDTADANVEAVVDEYEFIR